MLLPAIDTGAQRRQTTKTRRHRETRGTFRPMTQGLLKVSFKSNKNRHFTCHRPAMALCQTIQLVTFVFKNNLEAHKYYAGIIALSRHLSACVWDGQNSFWMVTV